MIILNIEFDALIDDFKIKNPPSLPREGEIFYCTWNDFIKDKKTLAALEKHDEEKDVWRVHLLYNEYSKNKVIHYIRLMDDNNYQEHIKCELENS